MTAESPRMSANSPSFRWWIVAIFAVALVWRIALLVLMPTIARDGVTFCWYARDLGHSGVEYLQSDRADQHPLFPALILAVHNAAGAPDSPLAWQYSGQAITLAAGLAVIALVGLITHRLIRRLDLPVDCETTTLCAMLMATILPLNLWLSVDVMSDQVHVAWYLGAVLLLLRLESARAAALCGLLGGLAFLTREEGIVIVAAGLLTLAAYWRRVATRLLVGRAMALLVGFLICAGPYWAIVGGFSSKKDPAELLSATQAGGANVPLLCEQCIRDNVGSPSRRNVIENALAGATPANGGRDAHPTWPSHRLLAGATQMPGTTHVSSATPVLGVTQMLGATQTEPAFAHAGPSVHGLLAKLELHYLPWYLLLPYGLYKLFRAGRVVIPLLALLPLLNLRSRWTRPPLAGLLACLTLHFLLTLMLLSHFGYLAPRHLLVPVTLLIPFAALLLARLIRLALERRGRVLAGVVLVMFMLPLAAYGARVPNCQDAFLRDAARWLIEHDSDRSAKRLIAGSSARRIAFYADIPWEPWYEKPEEQRVLERQILAGPGGYLVLMLGPTDDPDAGYERAGNRQLLENLQADPQVGPHLHPLHTLPGPNHTELHLLEIR